MGDVAVEVTLSIRAEHAEGTLWDAATARLFVVGGHHLATGALL